MARKKRFCPVDNCGIEAYGRGLCSKHYQRVRRYGRIELLAEQPRRGRGPHMPLPPHLSRDQWLTWAAGFVDGEGCIFIQHRNSTMTHYLKLTVPQLNPAPLHILQSLFGGAVRRKAGDDKGHRRCWIWEAAARQAADAITALLPYFVVKAEEARVALEFQSGVTRAIRGNVDGAELSRRHDLDQQLRALKARTYPG